MATRSGNDKINIVNTCDNNCDIVICVHFPCTYCIIWSSHSRASEDSSLFPCDAVLLGKQFLMSQRNTSHSFKRVFLLNRTSFKIKTIWTFKMLETTYRRTCHTQILLHIHHFLHKMWPFRGSDHAVIRLLCKLHCPWCQMHDRYQTWQGHKLSFLVFNYLFTNKKYFK